MFDSVAAHAVFSRMTDDRVVVSDEALAERVRATGDRTAFAALVTRYRGRIITLARRMLAGSEWEEAEDIAQETFLAAYEKRRSFERGQPYRPWLYRIAVNRCLDRLRTKSRRPPLLNWDSAAEAPTHYPGPEESLLVSEGERQLERAVAALPPKLRAVFLLRHLDALTYEEIAAAAGLPINTVKTHLSRARAALRAVLKDHLSPEDAD